MKIIYRANDIIEAHIVAGLLQSHDIQAFVGGHYLQGGVGELVPFGFATVSVTDENVDAAESVIAEYESAGAKPADADTGNPAVLPRPV
jgi:hypothetical protein